MRAGGKEFLGFQPMSKSVHRSPNKLWRSYRYSIFNLCCICTGDAGHNVVAIDSELLVNTSSTILVTLAVVRNTVGSLFTEDNEVKRDDIVMDTYGDDKQL
jgi:hypothetical protein